jgi:hypothetical protein
MRTYLFVLVLVLFSSCDSTTKKKSRKLNTFNFSNNLYEDRGVYPKNNMIDCPDFIRFLNDGNYYVLNDCGAMDNPRIDTIGETGKYRYLKDVKKLSFFNRKIMKWGSDGIFDTDLDTIHLEVVRISEDTLVFKGYKLDVFKKNKLDTLPLPIYFSRVK